MKAKKVSALLVATAMVCGIAGGTTAVHADPDCLPDVAAEAARMREE